jgi:hypothetical protein
VFVYRSYTVAQFRSAKELLGEGLTPYAAGRRLGIPSSTIRYWRSLKESPHTARRTSLSNLKAFHNWRPEARASYCYLLGLYLGDGCIGEPSRNSRQLVLTLDNSYPGIILTAIGATQSVMPDAHVRANRRPGCVAVCCCHPAWPFAFPQHGRGRKHTRPIRLTDWQRELTHRHPRSLLRGLFHSDGSRAINKFRTKLPSGRVADYAYVRYFFTNYSADIRGIFCEHCDLLGVRWTKSSFKNISVAHRDSVAILDEFLGPKW